MIEHYPGIERGQALAPMWAKFENAVVNGKKPSGNTMASLHWSQILKQKNPWKPKGDEWLLGLRREEGKGEGMVQE